MVHYSKKGRYDILQKLILNLDLTDLDVSPLLIICLEYDLINAMIYICTKSGDFLTPLIKLLACYKKSLEKNENQE